MERNEAIKRIKAALKKRSGKAWSVTGGRGTAWGWIEIDAMPAHRTAFYRLKNGMEDLPENYEEYCDNSREGGSMTAADRAELGALLGLGRDSYSGGENIPASGDYRQEYVDRAEGRTPTKTGTPYWD